MADMGSMNRENKKKQLRRQMIHADAGSRPSPDRPSPDRAEDGEEAARKLYKKVHRRRLIVVIVLLVLVGAGVFAWFYYQRNYAFTSYETVWATEINEGSLVGYEAFGSNVLKITRDGASYTDNKGKNIWTESYEMKNPIVSVNGDYAAIADKQGNSIYICNTDGSQGQATTVLPISKVAVSGTGIVAAVLEDSTSSYVTFFRKDGTSLDITVKTNMAGDGYPLDISLSRDGTQMMGSYVFIQNGELKNRVVFYDFSEIGKNIPNRLVGGFDEQFEGTLAGEVQFLGSPYSCAFSGSGLCFFSSKNLASPALVAQVTVEEEIQSVFHSDDYAGIVVRNNTGEFANRMEIYKKSGELVMKTDFTYDYKGVDIDGDLVILYNEDSCKIYNMAGVQKLYASFDFTVSRIRQGSFPNTLVVTGPQMMKEIRLH